MDIGGLLFILRENGWVVAVHNDYRLHGVPMTFWLFTKAAPTENADGLYITDEGHDDFSVLLRITDRLKLTHR